MGDDATHNLEPKPLNLTFPPISPIFAQNKPCKSWGREDIESEITWGNPDCSRPMLCQQWQAFVETDLPMSLGLNINSGTVNLSLDMYSIWSESEGGGIS